MLAIFVLLMPTLAGAVSAVLPWRRRVGWLGTAAIGMTLAGG